MPACVSVTVQHESAATEPMPNGRKQTITNAAPAQTTPSDRTAGSSHRGDHGLSHRSVTLPGRWHHGGSHRTGQLQRFWSLREWINTTDPKYPGNGSGSDLHTGRRCRTSRASLRGSGNGWAGLAKSPYSSPFPDRPGPSVSGEGAAQRTTSCVSSPRGYFVTLPLIFEASS